MKLLAALALAATVVSAQGVPQAPPFVATSADLVVLPVVVLDKHGFVTDLEPDRFTVYDNGRRQDIALFSGEDTPVTVGLVIDNSGSMRPKMGEVIVATLAFARTSNPQDELFIVPFSDTVLAERARLVTALDARALQAQLQSMAAQGRTALYDALLAALDRLERATQARKALVVVSDGGDNASRSTLNAVLERARRSNVMMFTIGLFDQDDEDRNPRVLRRLADDTGGERFLPHAAGDLLRVCTRIARELRSGYTIGFVPPDRDGTFHRVRVEVQRPGGGRLSVRSRPGYFAAPPPVTSR